MRKILKVLQKFFGTKLKGHKRRRLRKLAAMLCGLMRSKKPSMIALGSGLPQKIKAYSKEKEAKKFLENRFKLFRVNANACIRHGNCNLRDIPAHRTTHLYRDRALLGEFHRIAD